MKPDYADTHFVLSLVLFGKHMNHVEGVIVELREALDHLEAHITPDSALAAKHDLDGVIAEYHEVLLADKSDLDGAIAEYREALRVKPDFADAHYFLGLALYDKGDPDGAIAESREVLLLKPDYPGAERELHDALQLKANAAKAAGKVLEGVRPQPR